ncbi:Na+/H+ antiporter subunit E [Bartonella bovis]|uniref:Putative monovalent cation/H+ antiporter subunit E n=1 Tax=Bartonella bovis 91-4 TaxID=1094491 RepID=N6VH03_9HYPH|nr:Na+/H+ antiporter subunit E [Bartonella bovis]ENN90387.1 putative monovalent cation/H+ antiporter subunit E [Bartonella bovis 91-4]
MKRFFPHPFLNSAIVFMWLILNGFTLGQLLLGSIISLFGGWMIQLLEPEKITIKNWNAVFRLAFRVFIDSICANIMMAWFILTKKRKEQHSGFIIVPLALKSRTALAVLACIFSAIPGTVWIAYNSKNSELLVHVLNLTDGNDYQKLIKQRYEQLLLEIF